MQAKSGAQRNVQGLSMLAAGIGLIVIYTLVAVSSDAISKTLVAHYAAPQLMFLSAALLVLVGLLAATTGRRRLILQTGAPKRVALRSFFGAISSLCFFIAFGLLPFSQMFVFIGIMPLIAAVLSGFLLRERVALRAWLALMAGFVGVLFLLPAGVSDLGLGHAAGFAGALFGTISLVLSRGICRSHTSALAQVFYAQVACLLLGAALLPFVASPIALADLGMLAVYAGCLLATRWLMVLILRLLPAHVVMQITNIQFIWMVIVGDIVFNEGTGLSVWIGSVLVMASGLFLALGQITAKPAPEPEPNEPEDLEAVAV